MAAVRPMAAKAAVAERSDDDEDPWSPEGSDDGSGEFTAGPPPHNAEPLGVEPELKEDLTR
jgi:hypothetical protein